jgi:hypothetical protein
VWLTATHLVRASAAAALHSHVAAARAATHHKDTGPVTTGQISTVTPAGRTPNAPTAGHEASSSLPEPGWPGRTSPWLPDRTAPGTAPQRPPERIGGTSRHQAINLLLVKTQPHECVRRGRQLLDCPRPLADHGDQLLAQVDPPGPARPAARMRVPW